MATWQDALSLWAPVQQVPAPPSPQVVQQPTSEHSDEVENDLELIISGLGGMICTVLAKPTWAVKDIKAAAQAAVNIYPGDRLLSGIADLQDSQILSEISFANNPQITLVKMGFYTVFEDDEQDVQKVAEYAAEVHARLFEKEVAWMPRPNYMDIQMEINARMRAILIDWLVEVHAKYRFRTETLFLTVNIIDRYLSFHIVLRKKLQLVGVVAMFIATKFEEIRPPSASDLAYMTDNAYTKSEIMSMERTVLVALDFEIVVPTPAHFLDRLQRANGCDLQHRSLSQYCLELGLMEIRMLRHAPSRLVAAALLLSNTILGKQPAWPGAMVHHARYSEAELQSCAQEFRALLDVAPTASLRAVQRKYQRSDRCSVADLDLRQ